MSEEKSKWRYVGKETAAAHELYGVGGWLLFFAVGCILGLLVDLGRVNTDARSMGLSAGDYLSIPHPSISLAKATLLFEVIAVMSIYWMMFIKSVNFRRYASLLLLSMFPVVCLVALANSYEGVGAVLVSGFIRWAVSCAVWVSYLQLSKRVRVTFEHCIPEGSEDAVTQKQVASPPDAKPLVAAATTRTLVETDAIVNPADEPEERFWAIALKECNDQNMRPGLWAKAFADAHGQESVAKAQYMRSRAAQLQAEHNLLEEMKLAEQERVRQAEETEQKAFEVEQAAALAQMTEANRLEALKPKGRCPNCSAVINLDSISCPHCKADFSSGSAWSIKPLRGRELQANWAMQQAAHSLKPKVASENPDDSALPALVIAVGCVLLFLLFITIFTR
jgi:Zn finger protein HypA/HybF involved in hydrogenase expression